MAGQRTPHLPVMLSRTAVWWFVFLITFVLRMGGVLNDGQFMGSNFMVVGCGGFYQVWYLTANHRRKRERLLLAGGRATGTVVEIERSSETTRSIVELQSSSGTPVRIRLNGRLALGSTVQVIYDPAAPQDAMNAEASPGSLIQLAVLAAASFGVGLWMLTTGRVPNWVTGFFQ